MKKLMAQAEQDLGQLLKMADANAHASLNREILGRMVVPLAATLGAASIAGISAAYFSKKDRDQHRAELAGSINTLMSKNPDFAAKPGPFMERFSELSVISPTVAKNPSLASKLLSRSVDSGFSVDDIHKLTQIEFNTTNSRHRGGHPIAAGRAAASNALANLVSTFGSDMLGGYRKAVHDVKHGRAKIDQEVAQQANMQADLDAKAAEANAEYERKWGNLEKEGSVQKVSDECLGTMIAERYVMLKTAGLGNMMAAGARSAVHNAAFYAPALAIGGGIALMRHALENKRNQQLELQADHNFRTMMRDSDSLKENKEVAMEAFTTLKAVAPSLAARPLVAKTFIEYVTSQGRLPPETIKQLAETESQIRGIGASNKGGFFADLKSTMGLMDPKSSEKIQSFDAPLGSHGFGAASAKKGGI